MTTSSSVADLAAYEAAARAAWPGLDAPFDRFECFVRGRSGGVPDLERAADLYLVCACADRMPRALEALEPLLAAAARRGASRIDRSPAFADLVTQELRLRLLLGDPPRIAGYAGRAPLAAWLRTAAVRIALNLRRGAADRGHSPIRDDIGAVDGADAAFVRARYRPELEAGVRTALAELPERDRTVLRLSVRERLTIDELGVRLGVGRSTAGRYLLAARERLARDTRRHLLTTLGLSPSELDSVAASLRSNLDISLGGLLA